MLLPGAALLVAALLAQHPGLEEGRLLYEQMYFEAAAARLSQARTDPSLSPGDRREVYQLLARAYAAVDELAQTEATFAELLARDPQAPAPEDAPPRIREAFLRAKRSLYPPGGVHLEPLAQEAKSASRRVSWAPWAVAGASALALAGGAAMGFGSAADSRAAQKAFYGSDTRRLDDRAARKAAAANVLYGVGAVAAGATVFWVWRFD